MAGVAKFCSPLKNSSVRGFRTSARRLGDATPKEVKGTPYNKLNIGIPAESWTNEKRVACTPAVAAMFTKKGFTVHIQEGAGKLSSFRDDDFAAAGAKIVKKEAAFQQDITLKQFGSVLFCERIVFEGHHAIQWLSRRHSSR